jgi:biotin operon repressor
MTSALLHQRQRKLNDDGEIVATLVDYSIARNLLGFVFESIQADGLTDAIRETVEAVPTDKVISLTDLAERLALSKSTVSYRVKRAQQGGWIVNEEVRRGHPAKLKRGTELPSRLSALPSPEEVVGMFERSIAEDGSASPPPSCESGPLKQCNSCQRMFGAETLDKHERCPECARNDRPPF